MPPTVFYDGACPLCSREIAHYRRLDHGGGVRWVDIHREPETLERVGLDHARAMARFHVLDPHGQWQTGAWGFVELWSHLPGYRWLARAMRGLRVVGVLDRAYGLFARWRVRNQCATGACGTRGGS